MFIFYCRLRLNPKVLVNTAVCFFVACATKYDSDSDYLELFVMSISLFFTSLHYFYKVSLDENSKKKLIVQKYFDDIQETLYQWVTNNAVVGGDMFGCQVTESNWISSESLEKNKLETRVKVFDLFRTLFIIYIMPCLSRFGKHCSV